MGREGRTKERKQGAKGRQRKKETGEGKDEGEIKEKEDVSLDSFLKVG